MSMSTWFSWANASTASDTKIPILFPLGILERDFVTIDVINIYTKILTDVIERTQGLSDEDQAFLWDNCLASESSDGLITLLAKAMSDKSELFLVLDKGTGVLRKATSQEMAQIKEDYKRAAESKVGTYISFKNYARTDMIKLYSLLEFCTVNGLNKTMNIAKAIQIKIDNLRASVSLTDSAEATAQGLSIAVALSQGRDVMLDSKDTIETAQTDVGPTQTAMEMFNQKRSFYLGMPASYITGEAPKGLGDSGLGDAKAVERGLKNYFFAIVKPVLKSIFGVNATFKSEDFEQLTSALEAMKTFELTSNELISEDNKRIIINKLFGLPENEQGDLPELKPIEVPTGPGKPALPPGKEV